MKLQSPDLQYSSPQLSECILGVPGVPFWYTVGYLKYFRGPNILPIFFFECTECAIITKLGEWTLAHCTVSDLIRYSTVLHTMCGILPSASPVWHIVTQFLQLYGIISVGNIVRWADSSPPVK